MVHQLHHNILYACVESKQRSNEQLVIEHALGYVVSGETRFYNNEGFQVFGEGTIGLIRKNQLTKTIKVPGPDGVPFKSINIFLDQQSLKRYCAEHGFPAPGRYAGEAMINLSHDHFLKSYFDSLLPYFDQPDQLSPALAELKTKEAIELLLRSNPQLKNFLFDFTEPFKIDLEAFMNQNFTYHVSLNQFATLTGRSLATFKRDFQKIFSAPPEKWLLRKRLEHAHFLIAQKNQRPTDVYHEAGFENISHFSTAFKSMYGYTPSSLL